MHCDLKDSYIASIKGVHSLPALDEPEIDAFIKDADLDADLAGKISNHLDDLRRKIYEDPSLRKQFRAKPLRTLVEFDPRIKEILPEAFRNALDGGIDEAVCADAPPTGACLRRGVVAARRGLARPESIQPRHVCA